MKYCILLMSALVFVAVSCKKVETPKFKEDTLREGKWKLSHVIKKTRLADTVTYVDTLSRIEPDATCKADDYLEFKINNNGMLKTGENKCQREIDEIPFKWGITDNYTKMYIYQAGEMFFGNNDVSGNIKQFEDNQVVIDYYTLSNSPGGRIDTLKYEALLKRF
ncbi:MAG: hypothetical protein EOP56_09535 [Sphingobacteriales bacterium]|nr:MAG: hypothetical protein EOP56_09535 [Sphingobacteriales bacterium]